MYLALGWLGDKVRTVWLPAEEHPLFEDCISYSEEEIEKISNEGTDEELILALRSVLRYNVARIAGKWESTRPFIDDMISEGIAAIVEFVPKRHNTNSEYSVMRQATSYIINALEEFLNANQALSAPSSRTQKRKIAEGEGPVYLSAVSNDYQHFELEDPDPDTYKRDVMEAISAIEPRDEIDAYILCKDNWGSTAREIAKHFGISRQAVQRRRSNLYQQFLRLTR